MLAEGTIRASNSSTAGLSRHIGPCPLWREFTARVKALRTQLKKRIMKAPFGEE
jgi:hypothetical protein